MDPPLEMKLLSLCTISQAKLQTILIQCGVKKDLIIDATLLKPLERVCGMSWLRQRGIDKVYKMDPKLIIKSNNNRLYLIPACIHKYKAVLDHISSALSLDSSVQDKTDYFHIIIVPKIQNSYEAIMESRGLHGIVKLHSYLWEFISLDEGLLSLELPFLYKQTFVVKNNELISSIAMSLWSLSHVVGRAKVIFSIGKISTKVLDIMEIYYDTFAGSSNENTSDDIGAMLIIDRDQDYASTLLTPVTYSALLNETFDIKSGQLSLDVQQTKSKKGKINFQTKETEELNKNATIILDGTVDPIYNEIKYRHFSEVLSVLSTKAKGLKNENVKNKDIQEIKHFVANKLQQVTAIKQNLVNHVIACETIIKEMSNKFEALKSTETDMINNRNKKSNYTYLDENFGTDVHIHQSLRLLCLMSLTQGLSSDEYNTLISKYLNAFGHKYLIIFEYLANAGLLIKPSIPRLNIQNIKSISDKLPKWQSDFQINANKLKQIPGETDSLLKTNPSYVFNGTYIPLISAVCNIILTSESITDCLNKLSGVNDLKIGGIILEKVKNGLETFEEKLSALKIYNNDLEYGCRDAKSLMSLLKTESFNRVMPLKPKCILVFVLGGVTYAEIAACNIVQMVNGSKIIVASDSLITGSDLIAACM